MPTVNLMRVTMAKETATWSCQREIILEALMMRINLRIRNIRMRRNTLAST